MDYLLIRTEFYTYFLKDDRAFHYKTLLPYSSTPQFNKVSYLTFPKPIFSLIINNSDGYMFK